MISLAIIVAMLNYQLGQKRQHHERVLQEIKNNKADFIFDEFLQKKIVEANKLSQEANKSIVEFFDSNYSTPEDLKREIYSVIEGDAISSKAIEGIGNIIKSKSLNNIQGLSKDNNDLIVLETFNKTIIGDYSENCSTEDRFRTKEKEKSQQFAKELFSTAFDEIMKGIDFTFWHYLPIEDTSLPWYNEVKTMRSTDIENLKQMYIKYDADNRFLNGFEFLVSTRIYDDEDYFGDRVRYDNGSRNPNSMQLVITSGFNIIDQLKKEGVAYAKFIDFDNRIQKENRDFSVFESITTLFEIIAVGIFILLFLFVDKYNR
jgi:hypothetical protein